MAPGLYPLGSPFLSDEAIGESFDTEEEEYGPLCGRCYDTGVDLFPANCAEKPELLKGEPLGMYHCPDCGAMLLAGIPHPLLCKRCLDRTHPGFDVVEMKE